MSLEIIGLIVTFAGFILAASKYTSDRQKDAMEAGKRQQIVAQLQIDLVSLRQKLAEVEKQVHDGDGDMREVRADLKHIIEAIGEIKKRMDDLADREVQK